MFHPARRTSLASLARIALGLGLLVVLIGAIVPAPSSTQERPTGAPDSLSLEDLEGHWMGALEVGGEQSPRIGVRILRKADGSMGASAASIDQGAAFIPSSVRLRGRTVTVHMDGPGVTLEGRVDREATAIEGSFRQGDASLPLTLERVERLPPAGAVRSQTPRPPHPYRAEEVRFHNAADDVWLAGTLTKPDGPGPHPGVIVLSGSGPQDRGVPGTGGHQPQAVIADHLTKQGYAVLRYDKRGVHESTGSYGDATEEDLTRDALAAFRHMASRDDVAPEQVGFVGHSEGSLIAARTAARIDGPVGFLVSMAGPGLPLFDLLVLQDGTQAAAEGATDEEVELIRDFSRRYYRTALETEGEDARETALRALHDSLEGELKEVMTEYFGSRPGGTLDPTHAARDAFVTDLRAPSPAAYWREVRAPVLILNGARDSQVPAGENVDGLLQALEEAPTDRYEARIFPGLNHMFQNAETGAVSEYRRIEETIAPEVLAFIADWLGTVG